MKTNHISKIHIPKISIVSNILIITALAALVGFGATFGLRWALLATAGGLILLGVAVGN